MPAGPTKNGMSEIHSKERYCHDVAILCCFDMNPFINAHFVKILSPKLTNIKHVLLSYS